MAGRTAIVLDTNILIRDPGVIASSALGARFYIPEPVMRQLQARGSEGAQVLLNIVQQGIKRNLAHIIPAEDCTPWKQPGLDRLDITDRMILGATHFIEDSEGEVAGVYLATDDKLLAKAAVAGGLQVLSSLDLRLSSASDVTTDVDLITQSGDYQKESKRQLLVGIMIGIALSFAAVAAWLKFDWITSHWRSWAFLIVAILGGPILFLIRTRFQLSYGVLEVVVGLGAIFNTYRDTVYDAAFVLQVLGGLYVVVRGLDNMEKGLEGTPFEGRWRKIFSGR